MIGWSEEAAITFPPCSQLSAGEMKFETATPRTGRDRGCRGAKTIHLSFGFLRASVPPWCKGFVFGCGYVAPCQRCKGFCLWLRLRRAMLPGRSVGFGDSVQTKQQPAQTVGEKPQALRLQRNAALAHIGAEFVCHLRDPADALGGPEALPAFHIVALLTGGG